jgi:hypothetical protein
MTLLSYLLPSRVKVSRPEITTQDGILTTTFEPVEGMESLVCRLEVGFYRPDKDVPLPAQAGRAPDRVAVYWLADPIDLKPGDHLECISGPIAGVWEVRTHPDRVVGLNSFHHIEGQAIEVVGYHE